MANCGEKVLKLPVRHTCSQLAAYSWWCGNNELRVSKVLPHTADEHELVITDSHYHEGHYTVFDPMQTDRDTQSDGQCCSWVGGGS